MSVKDEQTLQVITAFFVLTDIFTIPFNALLITCIFAGTFYYITSSLVLVTITFIAPQILRLFNLLGSTKDKFTNPTKINDITQTIKNLKKEQFTDASVIDRIQTIKILDVK